MAGERSIILDRLDSRIDRTTEARSRGFCATRFEAVRAKWDLDRFAKLASLKHVRRLPITIVYSTTTSIQLSIGDKNVARPR